MIVPVPVLVLMPVLVRLNIELDEQRALIPIRIYRLSTPRVRAGLQLVGAYELAHSPSPEPANPHPHKNNYATHAYVYVEKCTHTRARVL